MNIDFPFSFNRNGQVATANDEDHICEMIEMFLFTAPGERVNRPDFGSGLLQMVFEPNSLELAATLQYTLQAELDRWLGDLILVQGLAVETDEATLRISIQYLLRRQMSEPRTSVFVRENMQ
jgi:phage baseplate assembly protein W